MTELSHVSPEGEARMVDVGGKPETVREAVARGRVIMKPATLKQVREKSSCALSLTSTKVNGKSPQMEETALYGHRTAGSCTT